MHRRHVLGLMLALPTLARATAAVPEAKVAALAWLRHTDAGEHAAAWASAGTAFKAAVTATQWQQAVQGVRGPLGAVRERKDKSASFTRSLPGAPDGHYAVLQFDTAFENKAQALETVTAAQEADGGWRVVGYFIR